MKKMFTLIALVCSLSSLASIYELKAGSEITVTADAHQTMTFSCENNSNESNGVHDCVVKGSISTFHIYTKEGLLLSQRYYSALSASDGIVNLQKKGICK